MTRWIVAAIAVLVAYTAYDLNRTLKRALRLPEEHR